MSTDLSRPLTGFQNMPNSMRRRDEITGDGSGFFISADGYAVTNY